MLSVVLIGPQAFELDPTRYDIAMALGIIHFNNTGDTEKVPSDLYTSIYRILIQPLQAAAYLMEVLKEEGNENPQRRYIAHLTLANIALVTNSEFNVSAMKVSLSVLTPCSHYWCKLTKRATP